MQPDRVRSTLGFHWTILPDTILRIVEFSLPKCSEALFRNFYLWEREGRLEYVDKRLPQIKPQLKLLFSVYWLRSLDASRTTVTNEVLSSLQGFRNLVKLDLSFCRRVTNLPLISRIQTLEVLKLSGFQVLIGLRYLCKMPLLKELELREMDVTDADLGKLSECRSLLKIDLSGCKRITSVNPLSSIETLEVIDLSGCTSLTHVGELGKLPVLKKFNLSNTRMTQKDVCSLISLRCKWGLPFIDIKR